METIVINGYEYTREEFDAIAEDVGDPNNYKRIDNGKEK